MNRYLLVAIGGAVGSMLRYFVGASLSERLGMRFPYGTLAINLSACFLIGLTLEYLSHHAGLSPAWRFLIPIGFIGGFSTFSTFEWETWWSLTNGAFWSAVAYVAISIVGGLIAVATGATVARAMP